jgi:LysM repeat protein
MATQQELCLTEAHGGCERFLHSREQRASSLAHDQIEIGRLEAARFGPFISPMPVAVDLRPAPGEAGRGGRTTRRRVPGLIVAGGVVLVGVVALAAILNGGRLPGMAVASPTQAPQVSDAPLADATASPLDTTAPTSTPISTPRVTGTPAATLVAIGDRTPPAIPSLPPVSAPPLETPTVASSPASGATQLPTVGPELTAPPTSGGGSSLTPSVGPSLTPTARPKPTARPTPIVPIARKYTVKVGDTIKSIATKFGLKPRDLRAVNDIGKDVVPGQRLLIPARPVPTPTG